ncbi:hypothetical protein GCM10023264_03950 [Sphingomonas daechungensis]
MLGQSGPDGIEISGRAPCPCEFGGRFVSLRFETGHALAIEPGPLKGVRYHRSRSIEFGPDSIKGFKIDGRFRRSRRPSEKDSIGFGNLRKSRKLDEGLLVRDAVMPKIGGKKIGHLFAVD